MRTRLRSGGATVGFFAFQDIITAVIGIVIFIALLLSLFIGTESDVIRKKRLADLATPEQLARLDSLRNQITTLQKELTAILSANTFDPDALISNLRGELEILLSQLDSIKASTPSLTTSENQILADLQAIRDSVESLKTEKARLEALEKQSLAAISNLEEEIRAIEKAILEEKQKQTDLLVVHDDSITSKRPILVVVSDDSISIQTLASIGEPPVVGTDIRKLLKPFDPLEFYTVYYIKPSTFPKWSEIRETIEDLGFDLGYEPILENQTIKLQPRRP